MPLRENELLICERTEKMIFYYYYCRIVKRHCEELIYWGVLRGNESRFYSGFFCFGNQNMIVKKYMACTDGVFLVYVSLARNYSYTWPIQ